MALTATLAASVLAAGLTLSGSTPATSLPATPQAPAQMQTQPRTPKLTPKQWEQRLELACGRVQLAIQRVELRQQRVGADATVKGSIARLERRADRLEKAGQPELAQLVRTRVTLRRQVAELLPKRLEALRSAEQVCAKAGHS